MNAGKAPASQDRAGAGAADTDFAPLDSIPNRFLSSVSGLAACLILLFWIALALFSFWFLFERDEPLLLRLSLVAISVGPPVALLLFFRSKDPLYDAIRIDRSGVHFFDRGKTVRQLRWKDLRKSPDGGPDISVERVGSLRAYHHVLKIWTASEQGPRAERLYFRGTRTFRGVFANAGELRAHFLAGVRRFRPGLSIDRRAYGHFYIDKNSGRYERRRRYMTNAISLIATALIIAIIVILVFRWNSQPDKADDLLGNIEVRYNQPFSRASR